jgi:hypothetical protein
MILHRVIDEFTGFSTQKDSDEPEKYSFKTYNPIQQRPLQEIHHLLIG